MTSALLPSGGENNTADDARTDEPNTPVILPIEPVGASITADANTASDDSPDDHKHKKVKLDNQSSKDTNQITLGSASETTTNTNSALSDTMNESSNTQAIAMNSSTSTTESSSLPAKGSQSPITDTKPTSIQPQQKPKSKTDIYGRIPSKEPKYPISCPTCGRIISVSRFAGHLEKCLGISGRSASPTKR
ncbi:hypothetical protein ACHAWO_007551 [Cyclotella atomus]|uniref:SAGA-associated factor 11 n=1 Tax=Cyclotella atomus TaxID=382360 RepID=A0ABD3NMV7_9STRA